MRWSKILSRTCQYDKVTLSQIKFFNRYTLDTRSSSASFTTPQARRSIYWVDSTIILPYHQTLHVFAVWEDGSDAQNLAYSGWYAFTLRICSLYYGRSAFGCSIRGSYKSETIVVCQRQGLVQSSLSYFRRKLPPWRSASGTHQSWRLRARQQTDCCLPPSFFSSLSFSYTLALSLL